MTDTYTGPLWIPGRPEPKGSMTRLPPARPGGKARWINDNPRYDDWEETMVATLAMRDGNRRKQPLDCPVELVTEFYLPKPPTTKFREAPIGEGIGDLDKLVRGVGDAIKKARIYADDARVTRIIAEKFYALPGHPAGARVELRPYAPPVDTPSGPMPIRIQYGRHNALIGSIASLTDLPTLLRRAADEMERPHAA